MFEISELVINEFEKRIPKDDDYFFGMSEKDITDYKELEKRIETEKIEQYHKDVGIIRDLKKGCLKNCSILFLLLCMNLRIGLSSNL